MKKIFALVALLCSLVGMVQAQEWKVKIGEQTPAFTIQDRKNTI